MDSKKIGLIAVALFGLTFVAADTDSCDSQASSRAASGVEKVSVKVPTGADGMTTEQHNIAERLKRDNEPGAIKHLYVISSYTGDVLIYSTVKGKVTSGGKRLTPTTVSSIQNEGTFIPVNIGGNQYRTSEVLQDDGTYGSSNPYLYWFDAKGNYHQQFAEGCIIHISDQPLAIKHVVLNLETNEAQGQSDAPLQGQMAPTKTILGKK